MIMEIRKLTKYSPKYARLLKLLEIKIKIKDLNLFIQNKTSEEYQSFKSKWLFTI